MCRYTYHRDDGGSNVLELDTALMQCADQQLAVFPSVLMFYVVGLNYFFFQHQYHLRSKKQTIEYKLTSFFSSFYTEENHINKRFSYSDFLSSRSHNYFTNITWFYYILSTSVKLNLDLKTSYLFNVSGGDKVKSQGQGLFPHF